MQTDSLRKLVQEYRNTRIRTLKTVVCSVSLEGSDLVGIFTAPIGGQARGSMALLLQLTQEIEATIDLDGTGAFPSRRIIPTTKESKHEEDY